MFGIDETLERRRGTQIKAKGIYRDPVRSSKSLFVEQRWYWAGLEILAIGGVAAGLAYLVRVVLKGIADSV